MVASTGINEQLLEASCKLEADMDARLCILSSPPEKGHRVFVVYIRVGGVLNRPWASRVWLLVPRCFHIPGPACLLMAGRANHGSINWHQRTAA